MSGPIDSHPKKEMDLTVKLPDTPKVSKEPNLSPTPAVDKLVSAVKGNVTHLSHHVKALNLVPDKPTLVKESAFLQGAFFQSGSTRGTSEGRSLHSDMQKVIKAHIQSIKHDSSEVLEIREYYQIVAKIFPIAASFLSEISEEEKVIPFEKLEKSLIKIVNEIKNQIVNNKESINIPKELKEFILNNDLENPESLKTLAKMIDNLKDEDLSQNPIPELADSEQMPEEITPITKDNQSSQPAVATKSANNNLVEHFTSIIKILGTLESFPPQQKPEVLMLLMGSLTMNSQGLIGENLSKINQGITDFTLNIATQLDLIPKDKSMAAKEYFSGVLDHILLGGILMGKTLALKSTGKLVDIDDAKELQRFLLENKQETKIFDQIPFSFLAFFVPFEDLKESASPVIKEAKEALMNLIRNLTKLVFMLLAVQTGGSKLGEGGIDLLLKDNAPYFIQIIDDLIFAMKKINEVYGVNVKYQMEFAEAARENLKSSQYDDFWPNVLQIFAENTDLEKFVKETQDADPLYEAIHSLVNMGTFDDASIRLGTQG